jgi:hypothetical protein
MTLPYFGQPCSARVPLSYLVRGGWSELHGPVWVFSPHTGKRRSLLVWTKDQIFAIRCWVAERHLNRAYKELEQLIPAIDSYRSMKTLRRKAEKIRGERYRDISRFQLRFKQGDAQFDDELAEAWRLYEHVVRVFRAFKLIEDLDEDELGARYPLRLRNARRKRAA